MDQPLMLDFVITLDPTVEIENRMQVQDSETYGPSGPQGTDDD